jgi:hypothetical protein
MHKKGKAMTQKFWERWLTAVGAVFAIFGVVMAVAGGSALFRSVFGPLIDPVFWEKGPSPEARAFQAWVYGTWGGTTAGFGLLIAVVAKAVLIPGQRRRRLGVWWAVTLWFVVDTGASVAFGVWGNALAINLPAYVALTVPLMRATTSR